MIKGLLRIILILFCVQGIAQRGNSSPYSSLGIGDEVDDKTVEEMAMGGVGTASTGFQLSFSNPASYASQLLTTYTIAGENTAYWFKDDNGTDNASNAYLQYLAIGIPMGEKAGFAFGLQLNSKIGYNITESYYNSGDDLIQAKKYEGNGGTSRVFLGFGYEIVKGLSFGIEGEHIFGNTESTVTEQNIDVALATKYEMSGKIKGFAFETGLLYKKELKTGLELGLGVTLALDNELNAEGNDYLYSISLGDFFPKDTILNTPSEGIYKTPLKTSVGVSLGRKAKWGASIDYSFRDAIEMSGSFLVHNPRLEYEAASKLSIGGFYIPRHNSISSYWHRVAYRGGIRLEKTGMMVNGTDTGSEFTSVNDFGISFGLGLPVGGRYSKLDTSFEYGSRGTTDNGLTKENYFNFRIGLAFADKWFNKREIN